MHLSALQWLNYNQPIGAQGDAHRNWKHIAVKRRQDWPGVLFVEECVCCERTSQRADLLTLSPPAQSITTHSFISLSHNHTHTHTPTYFTSLHHHVTPPLQSKESIFTTVNYLFLTHSHTTVRDAHALCMDPTQHYEPIVLSLICL